MKFRLFTCVLLVLICGASVWAADFGLVLDQSAGISGFESDSNFDYTGGLLPRVSGLAGENGEYYVSAGFYLKYKIEEFSFVPELLRTDINFRFNNIYFRLGRMYYQDPMALITDGLFDGAIVGYNTPVGLFSLGAWYTGLLFKDRANITMTVSDYEKTAAVLDYSDFAETYFAPKKFIAALGWEHPALGERFRTRLSALGQFDLGSEKLNTQYFVGKITLPITSAFFDVGGAFELKEYDGNTATGFAAELGLSWFTPIPVSDRLLLRGRYASGSTSAMGAFLPVTTVEQGTLLKAKLSGLSVITLDYSARLARPVGLSLAANYFIRNDTKTYISYPVSEGDGDGNMLGGEFFAWLLWSPFSDLRVNLGGGVFLPSMGNVAPDAASLWRLELNVILALF